MGKNGMIYDINTSNSYIIKYGKGFAVEYDYNIKFYLKGDYLNGLKNGKFKEYYEHILIFEGE